MVNLSGLRNEAFFSWLYVYLIPLLSVLVGLIISWETQSLKCGADGNGHIHQHLIKVWTKPSFLYLVRWVDHSCWYFPYQDCNSVFKTSLRQYSHSWTLLHFGGGGKWEEDGDGRENGYFYFSIIVGPLQMDLIPEYLKDLIAEPISDGWNRRGIPGWEKEGKNGVYKPQADKLDFNSWQNSKICY